jgi:alpha-tubulin suppressor-like RCC1 family protein
MQMFPRLVESPILEDETMISVASGARHSAVLTETGKMFSWGWNKYGQVRMEYGNFWASKIDC